MVVVRYIVGVIVGFIVGSFVNLGLITISSQIIPPPPGADLSTVEGLTAAGPLLQPKHFLFPFLAHSLGTFVSALVAALIVVRHKMGFALGMGVLGLVGGIAAVFLIPAPLWYQIVDLVLAYIPFAYVAGFLAKKLTSEQV